MTLMVLWFILSGGSGYLAPMDITPAACGIAPRAARLVVDREVNPRTVRWDTCEVDVRAKVASLPDGQYHLAATGYGHYNAPDPHTSVSFVIGKDFTPPAEQPAMPRLQASWTQEAAQPVAQSFRYELELDGVVLPTLVHACVAASATTALCSAPVSLALALAPGPHTARLRAVDDDLAGDYSAPVTFDQRAAPRAPSGVTVVPVKP